MSELKDGDEVAAVQFESIEEVLSSIRAMATDRNWTPQQVATTFGLGIAARAILKDELDPSKAAL
jgi:hypothetical protein